MSSIQKTEENSILSSWVSASAGTGKTTKLTRYVLELLISGTNPSKILCLTFTKAAAAEMQNRIFKELSIWASLDDEDLSARLKKIFKFDANNEMLVNARRLFLKVLDTPEGMKIQTIHSFCQSLIKRFPLEAGIAPFAKIIDEQTAKELIDEARNILITQKCAEDENIANALENIVWRLNEDNFTSLINGVLTDQNKLQFMLDKLSLDEINKKIDDLLGLEGEIQREEDIENELLSKFNKIGLTYSLKALNDGTKTDKEKSVILAKFLSSNPENRAFMINDYKKIFLTTQELPRKTLITKSTLKKFPESDIALIEEQERIYKLIDKIKSSKIALLSKNLILVCKEMLNIYKELKNNRAFLDYNDLVLIAAKLLSKEEDTDWILYKLDGGIDKILLDEAQDTSKEQWEIINALCSEFFSGNNTNNNFLVVGDEKQSIFSFQGADPTLFDNMHKDYADKSMQARQNFESVNLEKSFRSTPEILKCVDTIFADAGLKKLISHNDKPVKHIPHRSNKQGLVELWPLVEMEEKEEYKPWTPPITRKDIKTTSSILAENIAKKISSWIQNNRIIKPLNRAVQPGDIMIIVRSRTKLVDHLVRSLKKHDIPVAGVDRMVLTDHIAVMDLLALGEFLLLPTDDLILATLLKTPLIGISEDELFELAYDRDKESIFDRLKAKQEENDNFENAYNYLTDLLNKTDILSPFELYSYIIETLDGRKKFLTRLGPEAMDAIDEFLSLTLTYEASHIPSMQGFLHWIKTGAIEIKRDMEQSTNVVRIMTAHGSKGLQAPIVFLPDTTTIPTKSKNIVWSEGDIPISLWAAGSKNENSVYKSLKEQAKEKTYNEYIRLLYVALTRAEDELYICGYENASKTSDECWYNIIKDGISNIAYMDNDILRIGDGQTLFANATNDNSSEDEQEFTIPEFLTKPAPQEPLPSNPLTPSKPDSADPAPGSPISNSNLLKGKIIHKLLQFLPDMEPDSRKSATEKYVVNYANELSSQQQEDIINSVYRLLNDEKLECIFSDNSSAEVPIVGKVGDYVISGQIDRLIFKNDRIIIIDYKTSQTPPNSIDQVHKNYLKQMAAYRAAIREIYPDKMIETILIWTENASIMKLSDNILDGYTF